MKAPACEALHCPTKGAAQAVVTGPGLRRVRLCAECALNAQNLGYLLGLAVTVGPPDCAYCGADVRSEERAHGRHEPLHTGCEAGFDAASGARPRA